MLGSYQITDMLPLFNFSTSIHSLFHINPLHTQSKLNQLLVPDARIVSFWDMDTLGWVFRFMGPF